MEGEFVIGTEVLLLFISLQISKMEPLIPDAHYTGCLTLNYMYTKFIQSRQVSSKFNEVHNVSIPDGVGNHPVF